MSAQPLVSILIPSFNAERWNKQTLESAVRQDYPRIEVIMVDDGSTDRTLEVSRRLKSQFVRVITQPNAGVPSARNTALAHAQGEYIQWLDHDDLLALNKISNQVKWLEKIENDRVLLSGRAEIFYHRPEQGRVLQNRLCQDLTPSDYFLFKFTDNTFLHPATWLVSRKLSELAGPWWELRSPDDDGEYFCRVVCPSKAFTSCQRRFAIGALEIEGALVGRGGDLALACRPYFYGSVRISYAICLTGRIPAAAARTARGVGCRGSTAR